MIYLAGNLRFMYVIFQIHTFMFNLLENDTWILFPLIHQLFYLLSQNCLFFVDKYVEAEVC